jgi:hypothetical protein
MTDYTLKQLMALDNDALSKVARQVFSMQLDPFSELGQRAMRKRLAAVEALNKPNRISPAITRIIGLAATVIENILNYQDATRPAETPLAAQETR